MSYIQNHENMVGDVTYTTGTDTPCLTSTETLTIGDTGSNFVYLYDKTTLNNLGATGFEYKIAVSTNGNETIETLEWRYIDMGTYIELVDPLMVHEIYPDYKDSWYIIPEDDIEVVIIEVPLFM